ncbi:LamG domain-containing protein [Mangrovibacterium diazotrophicum]|uniref:Concanavalin A-like lectin/glucanase superfamily protein n=1 Tax=Mangrovibacterium diazotrophicum TaxID=1261403 RepID=A0A419W9V6_9BACT|nr:LamG domain-containing protein [Mangrovibacterium diazotrophicum]RKD92233.1 concanavalin A-like lectin/glucanase superfamily protein [Mangrovibacterium diazotrophicum]
MAVQPSYHWTFQEREGSIVKDSVKGIEGKLFGTYYEGYGRFGDAVKVNGLNQKIVFPAEIGQFGTSDFTIAFGVRIFHNQRQDDLDLFGNRSVSGHGNFFAIRSNHQHNLWFEVDQDGNGTNYIVAKTNDLKLSDGKWHHLAFVRKGVVLQVYFDGQFVVEAKSETGIANITNSAEVRLGDWKRGTPIARYEDLRIYQSALNPVEIQNLVIPFNRALNPGEIELIGTDDTAVILSIARANLDGFETQFREIRLGPNTGATLYQYVDFKGQALKLYADIDNIPSTKIGAYLRSIQIWSSRNDPFTGKWLLQAPNGEYLSADRALLTTASSRTVNELFQFQFNDSLQQIQLVSPGQPEGYFSQFLINKQRTSLLLIDDSDGDEGFFSIVDFKHERWLRLREEDKLFVWTSKPEKRSLFYRASKIAETEGQVGELSPGEVALYEHSYYHGRAWILNDGEPGLEGVYRNLNVFPNLDNVASSIRLGPGTGVSLFANPDLKVNEKNRENEIEDYLKNSSSLGEGQIGHDRLSSLRIFRTLAPEDVFESYSAVLGQDYRMVDNELEEFSSYRTIVAFPPGTNEEVEISATDFTVIEIDDETYEVDEVSSVKVKPNAMGRIMITSEAEGLSTPGLKFKTQSMATNERVVLFPDREVHRKIANMQPDELWNAKDAEGNPLVDQNAFTQTEIAAAQNTISRVMATVVPENAPSVTKADGVDKNEFSAKTSASRLVSDATEPKPWAIKFSDAETTSAPANNNPLIMSSVSATKAIWEEPVKEDDFLKILAEASSGADDELQSLSAAAARLKIGRAIKSAVSGAKSVTIGFAKDLAGVASAAAKNTMNIIVDVGGKLVSFVLDTVEKVAGFVEGLFEKIMGAIEKAIEFLRALFAWKDILDTQRYLVKAVNSGFVAMKDGIENAKDAVADFVDGLQDSVEDGMNKLVEALGVEPSEVQSSRSVLPESVEWFFSKLLSGSKKKGAQTAPDAPEQKGAGGLADFMGVFFERIKSITDLLSIGIGGLADALVALVKNPLRPQLALAVLIEAARDSIIQLLEIAGDLVGDFLNVLEEAVQLFQNLLNGEIKIPFISDLFKLIGAGKLNILNLTSLLVAIPLTAISKLISGEKPFEGEPLPDFAASDGDNLSVQSTLLLSISVDSTGEDSAANEDENQRASAARIRSVKVWGRAALTVDVMNGVINCILDAFAEGEDDKLNEVTAGLGLEIVSLALSGISWLASFPSSPGFPGGRPYNLCKHKLRGSKFDALENDEKEMLRSERVMWGWRTAVYWLDVALVMFSIGKAASSSKEPPKIQRMKRRDEISIFCYWVFSCVDLGLTMRHLNKVPEDDNPEDEKVNEIFAALPGMLSPIRMMGGEGAVSLAAIDLISTALNAKIGRGLLDDDLAELRGAS